MKKPVKEVKCPTCGGKWAIKLCCSDCKHFWWSCMDQYFCDKGRTGHRLCKEFEEKEGK